MSVVLLLSSCMTLVNLTLPDQVLPHCCNPLSSEIGLRPEECSKQNACRQHCWPPTSRVAVSPRGSGVVLAYIWYLVGILMSRPFILSSLVVG